MSEGCSEDCSEQCLGLLYFVLICSKLFCVSFTLFLVVFGRVGLCLSFVGCVWFTVGLRYVVLGCF